MITYTKLEAEFPYDGQYPNMEDFIPSWERHIYVHQSYGGISLDHAPLSSEGFSRCSALILKDTTTLESALFHIDNWQLSHRAQPTFEEFMRHSIYALTPAPKQAKELLEKAKAVIYHQAQPATRMKFKEEIETLNPQRTVKAQFVFGSESRIVRDLVKRELLDYFAIDVLQDIFVDSGRQHWSVFYNPENSDLFVDARSQKKVLKFRF